MPLLKRTPEQDRYSADSATVQDNRSEKRSKKVPQRVRQSALKDRKILEKIAAFRVPAHMLDGETSVAHPTPSNLSINSSVTPSNDNIPVWALTGDVVKAVAATAALQIADKPAYPFVFNLTPEAEAKALTHPRGFLESLKRSFDRQLARAGVRLPYWFAIDITLEGRLHIQGAYGAVIDSDALKEIMWAAWGRWKVQPQFQIKMAWRRCDDGWATYCMRKHCRVAKKIGQTFTVTRPLQQEAELTYSEIRRIMRGAHPSRL